MQRFKIETLYSTLNWTTRLVLIPEEDHAEGMD